MYDFLLVINIDLPPILHRFRVMVKFSLARGKCPTLTLTIPANIAVSDISLKQEAQLSQRDRAAACLNFGKI